MTDELYVYVEWFKKKGQLAGVIKTVVRTCRDQILEALYEEEEYDYGYGESDRTLIFAPQKFSAGEIEPFWQEKSSLEMLNRILNIISKDRKFDLSIYLNPDDKIYPNSAGIVITKDVISYPLLSALCFILRNLSRIPVLDSLKIKSDEDFMEKVAIDLAMTDQMLDSQSDTLLTAFYLAKISHKKTLHFSEYQEGYGPADYIREHSFDSESSMRNFRSFLKKNMEAFDLEEGQAQDIFDNEISGNDIDWDEEVV